MTKATTIINYYIENGGNFKEIPNLLNLWPIYNNNKLETLIDEIIKNNPNVIKEIKKGKKKALGFLIGQLKKIDKNIESKEAMELFIEKIN